MVVLARAKESNKLVDALAVQLHNCRVHALVHVNFVRDHSGYAANAAATVLSCTYLPNYLALLRIVLLNKGTLVYTCKMNGKFIIYNMNYLVEHALVHLK